MGSIVRIRWILRTSSLVLPAAVAAFAGCQGNPAPADPVAQVVRAVDSNQVDSFFSDANGWNVVSAYATIRYPNVGGDARSDACGRRSDGVWCGIANGQGKLDTPTRWNTLFTDASGWDGAGYYSTIQFPDLDGDGRADICGRGPNAPSTPAPGVWCALSNGATFDTPNLWNTDFKDAAGWNSPQYYSTIQFPDVDGDHRADLCARGVAGILCGRNSFPGSRNFGTAAPANWSTLYNDAAGWAAAKYYSTIHFPDIDGDHKADVCGRGPDASGTVRIWCGTSNGSTAFNTPTSWNTTFGDPAWDDVPYYSTIQFADVNGDGKDDLCGRGPGGGPGSAIGLWCALSNGSGFGAPTQWNATIGGPTWSNPGYYSTIRVGNGFACGRGSAGIYCAFSDGNTFKYELLESSKESDGANWLNAQYYSTIGIAADFKVAARGSAGIRWTPTSRDNLSIKTAADVDDRRTKLITKVWNRTTVETHQHVDSATSWASASSLDAVSLPAGTTVSHYRIDMPTAGGGSVAGVADHYRPPGTPTSLVILNPGHWCHYTRLPYQDAYLVGALLKEGHGVLATYMPQDNPVDCSNNHATLFSGDMRPANNGHPYIYFLDPIRRSLNTALDDFAYPQVEMAGLSGGGWTATVYAALDTRIQISIPVAGTEPFYMRGGGDPEQNNDVLNGNDFFSFDAGGKMITTGYKDLYVLGSEGVGRRQIQVLNRNDNSSFGEPQFVGTGSVSWNQSIRGHELEVRSIVPWLGTEGSFRLEINDSNDTCSMLNTCICTQAGTCPYTDPYRHEFSKNTQYNIILAELNGGDSFVAAPNGGFPFVRGMNGTMWRNLDGTTSWADTGLPMIGTPAVISGAVNTFDAFYRDPTNHIVHARYDGSTWTALTDISGTIIRDPVAVLWGSGRIDVVALAPDYALHHWWGGSGAWSSELVDGSRLMLGQPALTTWGPNRLDVFYRGFDSKLGHGWTTSGSGSWSFQTISVPSPGSLIKNSPNAVTTTNSLWAYVVGSDDSLYQLAQSNADPWVPTNFSSQTISLPGTGTPSAFRATSGQQTIYARLSGNLPTSSQLPPAAPTWSNFSYPATPFIGSAFANDKGVFIVDSYQSVWLWPAQGSSWNSLAAYIDR